jgi:probable phosphoglycerate mutase
MLLYYVRHGDPIYQPDSLTPLGERQAEAIGRRLACMGIDKVFTSPSTRAKMTAKPLCEMKRLTPTELEFAHENLAWQEMTMKLPDGRLCWLFQEKNCCQRLVSPEVFALGERWYDHPDFAGRGYDRGIARIHEGTDAFLASLGYEHDREKRMYRAVRPSKEKVAFFAHEGFGGLFVSSLLDIPYAQFAPYYTMMHTGLTVIDFPDEEGYVIPHIRTFSNEGHLYEDRLPYAYAMDEHYFNFHK